MAGLVPLIWLGGDQFQPLLHSQIQNRPGFAHVDLHLAQGQSVKAGAGRMLFSDGRVNIETDCGEFGTACFRTCSRESCCQNTFSGPGTISFGLKLPGDVQAIGLDQNQGWLISQDSFIAGTTNVEVDCKFPGCCFCCFNHYGPCMAAGMFLTHITSKGGPAMFWTGGYGAVTRHDVPAGKELYLNQPMFFACPDNLDIGVAFPGAPCCCLTGEGAVYKFIGPCVVFSQNRDASIWDYVLKPIKPKKGKKHDISVTIS